MSCNSKKHIDIQGHRGCRGLLPENSLPAFEKAIDLGVHTLELDVVVSKDLKVVVSHEPYINSEICKLTDDGLADSTMALRFNLFEMTYDHIKSFDCGSKYIARFPEQKKIKTYKPLLSEVFELVNTKNSKVKFNIEIKTQQAYEYGIFTPQPNLYVNVVLDEIKKSGLIENINLQSFDLEILEEIKKQSPKIPVALLVDEDETINSKLKRLSYRPEIISPYFKLLSQQMVKDYQSEDYLVIPWTVNGVEDMKKMIVWGVDGIITDYPDLLMSVLED